MINVDDFFQTTTLYLFIALKFVFLPLKFILRYLTNYFQRPYSFCFIIDLLLLINPGILMTVILIQNFEFINSFENFYFIFYPTFFNIIINYILIFHIYHLYGEHNLDIEKFEYNIKSYTKFILYYLFVKTKSGYFGLYFIIQICFDFYSINHLNNNLDYDTFNIPIVITFTKISIFFNLIFNLMHICMYLLIFLFSLCRINNSCLCKIIKDCFNKEKLKSLNNDEISNRKNNISFSEMGLEFFKFLGVYEYEKQLNIIRENNIINI